MDDRIQRLANEITQKVQPELKGQDMSIVIPAFIQVTLNAGRSVEVKKSFFKAIADGLNSRLGLRREDVFINLVEVPKENWSFGNGEATYA